MPWRFVSSTSDNTLTTAGGNPFFHQIFTDATSTATTTAISTTNAALSNTIYVYWTDGDGTSIGPVLARWAGNQLSAWNHQAALDQAQLAQAHQMQREMAQQQVARARFMLNEPPVFEPAAPAIHMRREVAERREMDAALAAHERWLRAHTAEGEGPPPSPTEAYRAEAATAKARELLLRFLDDEQALEFEMTQSFFVTGKSGARYRIRWGKVANIDIVGPSDPLYGSRLCVHPADSHILPVPDVMLAQLLHLRANDVETRRVANVHH